MHCIASPTLLNALLAILMTLPLIGSASAAEVLVPRAAHPWGAFRPGAWKQVRVRSETLSPEGQTVSRTITETTTRLIAAEEERYRLRSEAVVEVAGKRFTAEPQILERRYDDQQDGEIAIEDLGPARVTIDGRRVPVEVRQAVAVDADGQRVTTVHLNREVSPYVLRRQVTETSDEQEAPARDSEVEAIATELPYPVLGELCPSSYLKSVHRHAGGRTIMLEVRCDRVPGGVVARWSKELDPAGNVTRRSTLELVDFAPGPAGSR